VLTLDTGHRPVGLFSSHLSTIVSRSCECAECAEWVLISGRTGVPRRLHSPPNARKHSNSKLHYRHAPRNRSGFFSSDTIENRSPLSNPPVQPMNGPSSPCVLSVMYGLVGACGLCMWHVHVQSCSGRQDCHTVFSQVGRPCRLCRFPAVIPSATEGTGEGWGKEMVSIGSCSSHLHELSFVATYAYIAVTRPRTRVLAFYSSLYVT